MPHLHSRSFITRTGYAEVNGTRLYYELAGTGVPVVLMHMMGTDCRYWQSVFDTLTQRYQVVGYDARGFGRSDLPTTVPYTHADDLKALLDYLGITRAHLMGNSLGGITAIDFALAYPDATHSLILIGHKVQGAEWQPPPTSADQAVWTKIFTALKQKDKGAAVALVVDHFSAFSVAKTIPAARKMMVDMFTDYSWWHFQDNQNPVCTPAIAAAKRLIEITAPTLVIVGELDIEEVHFMVDLTLKGISGAQKVVMPGLDHVPFLEDPVAFNEIVLAFLADQ